MVEVSLAEIDSLIENLIEYKDEYFGGGDKSGIARLVGKAEDILLEEGEETNWDGVYLRKICKEKYYDWKEDKSARVI